MFLKVIIIFKIILNIYITNAELFTKSKLTDDNYLDEVELSQNGEYLIDDMVITENEYNLLFNNRNGVKNIFKRWPGRRVFYKFHDDFQPKDRIGFEKCVKDITQNTCIEFVERTTEPSYLYIVNNNIRKCSSSVGFHNTVQLINISIESNCTKYGKICHEVMHSLGFIHEHNVHNRDNYIYVNYSNIKPFRYRPFRKESYSLYSTYGVSYCFESLLHYKAIAFSKNGEDTILVKEPYKSQGRTIGNRKQLSDCDIQKINAMYKCEF